MGLENCLDHLGLERTAMLLRDRLGYTERATANRRHYSESREVWLGPFWDGTTTSKRNDEG